MRRVLVTGMSGTGKSSALAELRRRGFETVDTDEPEWTEWSTQEAGTSGVKIGSQTFWLATAR
jgi:dephospho-CoA kinase